MGELTLLMIIGYIGVHIWNKYVIAVTNQEIKPTFEGYLQYIAHYIKRILQRIKEA